MGELPELTKAEWLIMKCCWRKGKCTAREVYEEVLQQKAWRYQTVKTMLYRLEQKGYVKLGKVGPICLFEPAVSQVRVMGKALDSFVGTVLDGALAPVLAHLAKGKKLTRADIEFLKKLVEQHGEEPDK